MRSIGAFVMATVLLTGPFALAPAYAQVDSREGIALQNQIYQVRQELRALQDQLARGGVSAPRSSGYAAPPPSSSTSEIMTQLLTRVDSLEDQVRQLRGRTDELQNQMQRQAADTNKRIDDLAFQVNPQGAPGVAPAAGPAVAGPAPTIAAVAPALPRPPQTPVKRTPETALQDGYASLGRKDYMAAEAAAREVLANRTSPRAYDAQFLLAQALYGEHQYPQAAVAFDDAYNRSKRGARAQDSLLGLAQSLTAINEKKAACDTIGRIRFDFPQPRPDISSGMAATAQKAGCH